MPIEDLTDNQFFDMFNLTAPVLEAENQFKNTETNTDIFEKKEAPIEEKKELPAIEAVVVPEESVETDIFSENAEEEKEKEKAPAGRKPKYDFSDASGYFEDRVKAGKFVAVDEEVNGEKKPFIPKTPEEFDEFFDINLNYKLEEKQKELEDGWYSTKTPAWKTIAQFADKNASIPEVLSFMSGVQNINDLSQTDETTIEGAEQVYRTWLTKRGEPAEAIDEQVELAKNSDKLVSIASKYKPVLVQQEQQRLSELDRKKAEEQQMYFRVITENRNKAIEAIEAPIFGKQKLKDDEKAIVYDLIANPSQEAGGYGIYAAIDKLYENKDFSTLRELALLMGKKDSYLTYANNNKAQEVATGLQRTLSVANKKTTSSDEEVVPRTAAVSRQQYANNNAFSRR